MFDYKNTVSTAGTEMRSMIDEAEQMLHEASSATGEKANDLQKKGLKLLSSSISKARDLERAALASARDIATSTDTLVHANPWKSVAISGLIAAGIGLAVGIAISRDE